MLMIAVGWLWVAFMMAITEKNVVSGVMTFAFYGLVPCAVLLYLLNKQAGRRRLYQAQMRERENAKQQAGEPEPAPEDSAAKDGAAQDGTTSGAPGRPPTPRV